ncbi:tetratricopeptide repeat protein [Psychromonas sp.]|uniref:tetratricopeptide repeat protein n=1 Tax=Psychromonas sp. TaxID=1884585 RepID=UPI003568D2FB
MDMKSGMQLKYLMLITFILITNLFASTVWAVQQPRLSAAVGKQVTIAFALYEQGKLPQALQQLSEIKNRSSFDKAYVNRFIGNLYWELGNEKKALEALKIALSEDVLGQTEQRQTQRMLADLYLNQKQTTQAIALYNELIGYAESESLYQQLAMAYYQEKSWQALIEASNKAIALATEFNKSVHILQLSAFYELENYKSANKILIKLTELYPEDKRWWMQLASTYRLLNEDTKALATYELAYLNGFVVSSEEIQYLANFRAVSGSPYQAALLLESAVNDAVVAKNALVYQRLASFWQTAREHDKAQQYWGESASLSGNAQHRLIQAQLLHLLGRYEEMLSVLDTVKSDSSEIKGKVALTKIQALFELESYAAAMHIARVALTYPSAQKRAASWLKILDNKLKESQQIAA